MALEVILCVRWIGKKNCAWFNLQWIRLCHVVITLTYPLRKVDPHGLFGIVAKFLHTWHELILTRVYEHLFV